MTGIIRPILGSQAGGGGGGAGGRVEVMGSSASIALGNNTRYLILRNNTAPALSVAFGSGGVELFNGQFARTGVAYDRLGVNPGVFLFEVTGTISFASNNEGARFVLAERGNDGNLSTRYGHTDSIFQRRSGDNTFISQGIAVFPAGLGTVVRLWCEPHGTTNYSARDVSLKLMLPGR